MSFWKSLLLQLRAVGVVDVTPKPIKTRFVHSLLEYPTKYERPAVIGWPFLQYLPLLYRESFNQLLRAIVKHSI